MKLLGSLHPEKKLEPARKAEVHENEAFSLLSKAFMELLECNEWRLGGIALEKVWKIKFGQKDVELLIPFIVPFCNEPNFGCALGAFLTALVNLAPAGGLVLDLKSLPKGVSFNMGYFKDGKSVSVLLPKGAISATRNHENYLGDFDFIIPAYHALLVNPKKDPSYSWIRMLTNCPRVRMHEGTIEYDERGRHFEHWEG